MSEPRFLLVYGSLMSHKGLRTSLPQQQNSAMHRLLLRHARSVGTLQVPGKLWLRHGYPVLVPDAHSPSRVQAELYELLRPAQLLPELDAYELSNANHRFPREYQRSRLRVTHPQTGHTVETWVYSNGQSLARCQPIHHGDWQRFCRERAVSHPRPLNPAAWC
ncbi:gamma-glutamylcyclotransferase family protein [Parathalassolituus penaei]|uniref:Gamma-glutamylcyclotransferase n=1 Tax=Parathalassolituus penaei TaxID=2997323 RepID=A0A9X3IST9_9GAMM|nr:gamma-glutamylcyclotransferase family protein [Parathalassolituus penaei]MCY0966772.1 gamma-glutamylcyclotransferase [Parathalassolituus penaei]